ncbi:MAG TPA: heterodisulfide reductase-related iron-sulfur binding cluster, partial [Ktedonobacteraceae bacterium]|nr:heterodisulfide reductase-related iron-sulfur binding cluster [Ktedonobacteraceae bacterium]
SGGFQGQDTPDSSIVQRCVRCGLCLPHCPTYQETLRETSSPRGRIHLIEAVGRGQLNLIDRGFIQQMYQCLDCRACEAVCPSGVEYGKLVESARTQIERARPLPLFQRILRKLIFKQLFGNMRIFRGMSRLLYLYQRSGLQWLAHHLGILRLLRLAEAESLLPQLPSHFVVATDQRYSPQAASGEATSLPVPGVALFNGCIMSTAFAETNRATIRVLQAHGCSVSLPSGQGCCGALTIHAGDMDEARVMARRNIEAFERSGIDFIVVNAAGCGAALKEYTHLLHDDPQFAERAARFSARVRDISEFLLEIPAQPARHSLPLRVTYQEPCHLVHAQRISSAPRQLLKRIPGLELTEMAEASFCCGSAGIYNLTQPVMSARLRARKTQHTVATGAEVVITANPGCLLQLRSGLKQQGSKIQVMHLVDILDRAYQQELSNDRAE